MCQEFLLSLTPSAPSQSHIVHPFLPPQALTICMRISAIKSVHSSPEPPANNTPLPHLTDIRRPSARVRHGAGKADGGIECIRNRLIPHPESQCLFLCITARRHRRVIGLAHVDELVAQRVRDDGRVEGLALSAAGKGVGDLEGELVGVAVVDAGLEDDGRDALAEVCGAIGVAACIVSSTALVVLVVIASLIVVLITARIAILVASVGTATVAVDYSC